MTETSADLRDAFRKHLQLTSHRDAYDRLLAETRLQPEFDDSDPKMKVVSLRCDECIPYQLELYKWGLLLTIGEPACETWARLGDAPHAHFWPRFIKPQTDEKPDRSPGLRIASVFDVADIIDFSRHTDYALAN